MSILAGTEMGSSALSLKRKLLRVAHCQLSPVVMSRNAFRSAFEKVTTS